MGTPVSVRKRCTGHTIHPPGFFTPFDSTPSESVDYIKPRNKITFRICSCSKRFPFYGKTFVSSARLERFFFEPWPSPIGDSIARYPKAWEAMLKPIDPVNGESKVSFHNDILTVDVEDYFHVEAFADRISRESWGRFSPRVRPNTERILRILAESGCRGTFFVLGWVAERDPRLVRQIADAGHEIACHSHLHRRVSTLTPEEFREDLRRARSAIEDAGGARVQGYRAPTFSIGRDNLWALEILSEEGFLYDSSIFPIRHDLYGFPGSPRFAYRVACRTERTFVEVPMTTVKVLGTTWPVGGGGYLRLLPMSYTRWSIERVHRKERQRFILYLHPWELDPEQPRIAARWTSRFRHYTGLRTMESRLRELLSTERFTPMIDLVSQLSSSEASRAPMAALPSAANSAVS
jgi:polysaccharide deacetylase family protein (PEP-CTERM system associated)